MGVRLSPPARQLTEGPSMKFLYVSISDPDDFTSGGNQRSNYMREDLQALGTVDTIVVAQAETSFAVRRWSADRVMKVATAFGAGRIERARQARLARRLIARADAEVGYDHIVCRYLRTAKLVPVRQHRKLVIDADDFRQNGPRRSLGSSLWFRLREALVSGLAKRAFHVWVVDYRDRHPFLGARWSMLPNTSRAVDRRPGRAGGKPRILMVGSFGHPPNEEGLRWFATHVFPALQARFAGVELHVVGRYYKQDLATLGERIVMRGFVDDLDHEYADATVVVCPILSGSGTQIKLIEGLMSGKAVVASDFSFQGFADVLDAGRHLLVANGETEWIEQVSAVLANPDGFQAMAERGRKVAELNYSRQRFRDRIGATFAGTAA